MTGKIDVFISYKREERALSEQVRQALIAVGYTAVTDLNINKSEAFGDAIDTMIRSATLTLVLWTKASVPSEWVREEARLARDLAKAGERNRYLGVLVEDVSLKLPPDLRGLQMVDIHDGGLDEVGMEQLLDAARDILGAELRKNVQAAEAASKALAEEWELYDLARSINVAAAYKRYLQLYPDGEFADDARRQLDMFSWYLYPFRRGNISNTIAALGIVGTVLVTIWATSRDAEKTVAIRDNDTTVISGDNGSLGRVATASPAADAAAEAATDVAATAAAEAAEAVWDAANAAAEATRDAETSATSSMDPALTSNGFDLDAAISLIENSDLGAMQKSVLTKGLEAAQGNPELLEVALSKIHEALDL
ncbi:MAG: toll/interleukin-1 receptor domain-containing protein [Sulfitobacter sp.]